MISVFRQFWLLLWKTYIIKRKQRLWVVLEIVIPIFLFLLLVLIRTRNFDILSSTCHYDGKSFPSAGVLPFMHSIFCSLSNDCGGVPTTSDETYDINKPTEHESIIIKLIRWLISVAEVIGEHQENWAKVFQDLAEVVHLLANYAGTSSAAPATLTFPIAIFFSSQTSMINQLQTDLGLSKSQAEKFKNISVTPKFFGNAFHTYQKIKNDKNTSFLELLLEDKEIDLFCNETLMKESFLSVNNEVKEVGLCNITFSSFLPLLMSNNGNFNRYKIIPDIATIILSEAASNSNNNNTRRISQTRINELISSVNQTLGKFPPFDFGPFFGDNEHLLDAIFCGNFLSSLQHSTGQPQIQLNALLNDFQKKVQEFVMKLTPGQSHSSGGVNKCGDMIVEKNKACDILNFLSVGNTAGIKTMFNGLILVSPDVPITRELVRRLNQPLLKLNYFRDLISDFVQASDGLQDEISQSDLQKAAKVITWLLPSSGLNETASLSKILDHLFQNSSDSKSLLIMAKHFSNQFLNVSNCFRMDRFRFMKNEKEIEKQAMCLSNYDMYFSGIVFPDNMTNSKDLSAYTEYKIRHNHDLVDGTDFLIDKPYRYISRDSPFRDLKYLTFGFSFLQEAVEKALVSMFTNETINEGLYAQQEPYPCVQQDWFNVTVFLSLFLILSWMIPSALLVKNIVWEKEVRLKEMMRIMGLGDMIHFLVWATQDFIFNLIAILIICIMFKFGNLLPSVDFSLILLVLILFALACIAQCILLSTFFTRANIATASTALLFFLFFVPYQLSVKARSPTFTLITLILPQTGIGYGLTMIALAESSGMATWDGIYFIELDAYHVNLPKIMIAFVFDIFIYTILAWYISAVFPGTYGVPQPWNFFIKKSYWFNEYHDIIDDHDKEGTPKNLENDNFEEEPELPLAVDIIEMDKVYGNHTKALDNLSVRFYESQITAFLGHNGAGKSTTISILSGLFTPTRGTAYVYGKDIRKEMPAIRDSLGVCPQHNILFDAMTVEEQLRFYGSLKGLIGGELDCEVEEMLADTGLKFKRSALSTALSGGMKRKLCIGIALIGGSKLVILDEPTAGIDAHARRGIWSLLLKHKRNRTMILSTHHMDEADVLADRIAIIAEGQLKTAGSGLFLKRRFGNGYQLTLARPQIRVEDPSLTYLPNSADSEHSKIDEFIKVNSFNNGILMGDVGTEITFNLPLDMEPEKMQKLFDKLDKEKVNLGIESYGISAPSLQQIFVKIAPSYELKLKKQQGRTIWSSIQGIYAKLRRRTAQVGNNENVATEGAQLVNDRNENERDKDQNHPPVSYVKGSSLTIQHAYALFAKRWYNSKRTLLQLFCLLICPILLLFFAEMYAKLQKRLGSLNYDVSEQPLYLTPVIYGNYTEIYFGIWNRNHSSLSFLESMMEKPGIGNRCMTNISLYNETDVRCLNGYAKGYLDLEKDNPKNISYNVPQICGCTSNSGWNCTDGDYPLQDLQTFTLNTSDRIWDLTYRNISQFRLVTSKNTTGHREVILGGFTFGHENIQSMTVFEERYTVLGLETIIDSLKNASVLWNLNWENATDRINWTTSNDPFLPKNMSPLSFVEQILPLLDTEENSKVWFNNKAWAALPINTNSYHNAILRALRPQNYLPEEIGIMTINHPMNQTVSGAVGDNQQLQKTIFFRVVVMILVLSFIPASVCMLLVEERSSFSRHLQSVFGVSPWMYWITNFIYDYTVMFICSFLIVIMYSAMGVAVFTYSWDAFFATIALFSIYHFCTLPSIYVFQYIFDIPAVAYAMIAIGLFFVGVVSSMCILLLENLISSDETLIVAHSVCSVVFLIIPQYNLGIAVSRINFVYGVYVTAEKYLDQIGRRDMIGQVPLPDIATWELMGKHFFALFVDALIFIAILIILEYQKTIFKFLYRKEKLLTKKLVEESSNRVIDKDVQHEQNLVNKIEDYSEYGLVVKNLAKAYSGQFLAVNNLSFAVKKGECFGLLGVNGAGKTTTFSMLTGRVPIGFGDAYIQGNSVTNDALSSFRLLGYCPQFDALNLKLTAKEQLTFYARIRGIREEDIPQTVNWAIAQMQLWPYANEVSGSFSGGNKRKLSAAIALVADPPVILLDEPSAGVDISSQEFLWKFINQMRQSGRTIILTSHSMEECEALCSRTAIMVDGQFGAIGSIQHLKERFGKGYTLTIKVGKPEDLDTAKDFIHSQIPGSLLQSIHVKTLFFRIRASHCSLTIAFGAIASLQKLIIVEDYSLSQTTLDDVFVSFAARSEAENGEAEADSSQPAFDEIIDPLENHHPIVINPSPPPSTPPPSSSLSEPS